VSDNSVCPGICRIPWITLDVWQMRLAFNVIGLVHEITSQTDIHHATFFILLG